MPTDGVEARRLSCWAAGDAGRQRGEHGAGLAARSSTLSEAPPAPPHVKEYQSAHLKSPAPKEKTSLRSLVGAISRAAFLGLYLPPARFVTLCFARGNQGSSFTVRYSSLWGLKLDSKVYGGSKRRGGMHPLPRSGDQQPVSAETACCHRVNDIFMY